MADDVTLDSMAGGKAVATDEIADRHFQLFKLTLGDLNSNNGPVSANNPLPVRQANPATIGNLQTSAAAVGVGTAVDVSNLDFVALNVRGITTAVIVFQASIDGTNYDNVYALTMGTWTLSTTTIANGNFLIAVAGYKYLRANITSYGSGSITVTATPHKGVGFQQVFSVMVNKPTFENDTDGLARIQKKYTLNPLGAPLRGTSLYAAGSAAVSIKASAGALFNIHAHHITSATVYFQLHDKASAPSSGNVPIYSVPLAQYEKLRLTEQDLTDLGVNFTTGIAAGFSSVKDSYTAHGTATDCFMFYRYL